LQEFGEASRVSFDGIFRVSLEPEFLLEKGNGVFHDGLFFAQKIVFSMTKLTATCFFTSIYRLFLRSPVFD
jgi:hypothetical protein